jgi:hypothetical protein
LKVIVDFAVVAVDILFQLFVRERENGNNNFWCLR